MQTIWMLSPTAVDGSGNTYPTCSAYTQTWQMPWFPAVAGTPGSITHVQDVTNSTASSTSVTTTLTTPITAGNLIMITAVGGWTGSGTSNQPFSMSCADSAGNHYTYMQELDYLLPGSGSTDTFFVNFYCVSPSSVSTITITTSGVGSFGKIVYTSIHEYSGVDSVHPCLFTNAGYSGVNTSSNAASMSIPVPVITAGEMVFAVAGAGDGLTGYPTLSINSGFTSRGTLNYSPSTADNTVSEWDYLSSGLSSITISETGGSDTPKLWGYAYVFQPTVVPTGLGLVCCYSSPTQIAAAKADPTIVVCPANYQNPCPALVTQSYYPQGAITNMSFAALLNLLCTLDQSWNIDPSLPTVPNSVDYYIPATAVAGIYNAQSTFGLAASGIAMSSFIVPYPVVVLSNIYAPVAGTDSTNLHTWGIYSMEGQLIVASTPRIYPTNGLFNVAETALSAGQYWIAWTCNGTTTLELPGGNAVVPGWAAMGTPSVSASGVLPATITVPEMINYFPISAPCLSVGLC